MKGIFMMEKNKKKLSVGDLEAGMISANEIRYAE